jgi:hypothetical protein
MTPREREYPCTLCHAKAQRWLEGVHPNGQNEAEAERMAETFPTPRERAEHLERVHWRVKA